MGQSRGIKWYNNSQRHWPIVSLPDTSNEEVTEKRCERGAVIEVTNELNANLASIVKAWQTTVDLNNQQLFNGSVSSIGMLHNEITQGIVLEAGFQQDDLLLQNAMEQAIYGFLIPKAWSLSNEGIGPVVM